MMLVKSKLLPLGKVYLHGYEETEITRELLEKLVANFKAGYPHYKPFVNLNHDGNEKYGEVVELELADDGLYVTLQLTDEGARLYEAKKYEYLSAEIDLEYRDRTTGELIGPVLIGVALTNRPAMPIPPIQKLTELWHTVVRFFAEVFNDSSKQYAEIPIDYDDSNEWDWDWARDADAIIDKFGWRGLAKACLWYDRNAEKGESGYPEAKKYYALPVAKARGNKLVVIWGGVRAARQRLASTDIPSSDKQEVIQKLRSLYKKFGKEFDSEDVGGADMELQEKLEKALAEKQQLEQKIAELQVENKQLRELLKLAEAEKLKNQLVGAGVIPTVAEHLTSLFTSDKLSKDEVLQLADKLTLATTKQFATKTEEPDVIELVKKYKNW